MPSDKRKTWMAISLHHWRHLKPNPIQSPSSALGSFLTPENCWKGKPGNCEARQGKETKPIQFDKTRGRSPLAERFAWGGTLRTLLNTMWCLYIQHLLDLKVSLYNATTTETRLEDFAWKPEWSPQNFCHRERGKLPPYVVQTIYRGASNRNEEKRSALPHCHRRASFKNTINTTMKTWKRTHRWRICPEKNLTNHSARKTVIKKLKCSVTNLEVWNKEYHRSHICPRAWRLRLRRRTRAADYFTRHWQHWSCSSKTRFKSTLSCKFHCIFVCSWPCLQFQSLQCHLEHRREWCILEAFWTLKLCFKKHQL